MNPRTRREFLWATAGAVGATAAGTRPVRAASTGEGPLVCAFAKHLQFIKDFQELARTAKALGLDGLDLAVRRGGHVEPKDVERELGRAVEAVRAEGLDIYMVTTNLNDGSDPDAEPILRAASALGIRYARVGGLRYADDVPILDQLNAFLPQLRSLAALLERYEMVGGYHNHSGGDNVGAPIWDLHRLIEAVGSDHFGSNFDAGHATVEGGSAGWEINTRLMAPHVKMMAVKDFRWVDKKVRWVPLGEGQVPTVEILRIVRAAGFAGPISLHFEYDVASNEAMLEEIRRSAGVLREYLRLAGFG